MDITPESRVGEIAAHHPLATRVLARHGIDFCCGGGVPLREACERRNLSTERLVAEMRQEAAGEALARLRSLTEGYRPPADACNTWRALWAGLEALEGATHQHIHLENNVLFPRAANAA